MFDLRRRKFITPLCGIAAWQLAVRGQQNDQVRRRLLARADEVIK
jgi:hypothetical protein